MSLHKNPEITNNELISPDQINQHRKDLYQSIPLGDYCDLETRKEEYVSLNWENLRFSLADFFGYTLTNVEGTTHPCELMERSNVNETHLWFDEITTYHKGGNALAAIELWGRDRHEMMRDPDWWSLPEEEREPAMSWHKNQINFEPTFMTILAVSWLNFLYQDEPINLTEEKRQLLRDMADKTRQNF